jgi:ribosome maturation factor RimP
LAELKESLKRKLLPLIEEEGLELVELEFTGKLPHSVLRVYVDQAGGIDVEECARLSRKLSDFLDTEDLIEKSYTLEVSSPGLDRPLFSLGDFKRKTGEKVRLYLKTNSDKSTEVIGEIAGVEEEEIRIKIQDKVEAIPLEKIEKGKIII